jgi:lipopolysaccharide assembly protein A
MTAWKIRLIAAAGLAVLAAIWILQNRGAVQTRFLFVTLTMPQSALLAITLLLGIAGGVLLALGLSGTWPRTDSEP